MDRCFFAESAPEIQVRGDLFFIIPESREYEVAVTPHTLEKFVARANKALDQWRKKAATVVPIARH